MQTFIAHYHSPNASLSRSKGLFEFQSEARAGSKANVHDARMAMLEQFGKDAVSWTIDKVEHKKTTTKEVAGQLELDFREPVAAPKRARRFERGKV